jgi:hypothetical protein
MVEGKAKREFGMRAGGREGNGLPVGSLAEQNKPPAAIGSSTETSEPIGGKTRITSVALRRAVCVADPCMSQMSEIELNQSRMFGERRDDFASEVTETSHLPPHERM